MEEENQKLEEGDVVLCTVKKIEGTTVFLDIEGNGEGSMIISEVSPGRIRNLREFVAPNKKIVCKVLRIRGNHPELSLRRVTGKERDNVLDRHRKDKTYKMILKTLQKEKSESTIYKIKKSYDIVDFFEEARESPKILEKFFSKQEIGSLNKMLAEKQQKEKEVRGIISVRTLSGSGILEIRQILDTNQADIRYLGSSKFSITVKEKDFKRANSLLSSVLEKIKENSKKHKAILEIKEK